MYICQNRLLALVCTILYALCASVRAAPAPLESQELIGESSNGIEAYLSVMELTNEGIPSKIQLLVKNSNAESDYVVRMPNESNSPTMLAVFDQSGALISKRLNTVRSIDSDEHPPSLVRRQLRPGETSTFILNVSDYLDARALNSAESVSLMFIGSVPYSKVDGQVVESIRLRHTIGSYNLLGNKPNP